MMGTNNNRKDLAGLIFYLLACLFIVGIFHSERSEVPLAHVSTINKERVSISKEIVITVQPSFVINDKGILLNLFFNPNPIHYKNTAAYKKKLHQAYALTCTFQYIKTLLPNLILPKIPSSKDDLPDLS